MAKYKNYLIIGAVFLTLIVVLLISYLGGSKKEIIVKEVLPTATPTLKWEGSESGAVYITPTEQEYAKSKEESALKLKAPIDTGGWIIDYDWKKVNFTAKAKTVGTSKNELLIWLQKSGYELVTLDVFTFIE